MFIVCGAVCSPPSSSQVQEPFAYARGAATATVRKRLTVIEAKCAGSRY